MITFNRILVKVVVLIEVLDSENRRPLQERALLLLSVMILWTTTLVIIVIIFFLFLSTSLAT